MFFKKPNFYEAIESIDKPESDQDIARYTSANWLLMPLMNNSVSTDNVARRWIVLDTRIEIISVIKISKSAENKQRCPAMTGDR